MNQRNPNQSPSPVERVRCFYRVEMLVNGRWISQEFELQAVPPIGPMAPVAPIRQPEAQAAPAKHSLPTPKGEEPKAPVLDAPAAYIILFGMHKGKTVEAIGAREADRYSKFLRASAIVDEKPLRGKVLEAVLAMEAFAGVRSHTRGTLPKPRR